MKDQYLNYQLIDKDEIPKIPLYMDQVTGYLDDLFDPIKKLEAEKTLTKTMINNYVKASVIKSPEKKKYKKDQIMELMMIYLLKNTSQIQEIDMLFKSFEDSSDLYDIFRNEYNACVEDLKKQVESSDANRLDLAMKLMIKSSVEKRYAEMLLEEEKNDA
ncbi:DUF1836 domain-containing protein [Acidaminobacter sp. JC074]|uniref:DUF1836 domain-containing protein n=1 Tax=Acidaminobacter sp. JC074 TaxID=2530199 RepID=UPI001F0F2E4C|nr:DUF1836 domain-containing protein [Acidaminobacter sp. JC074]MCH4887257.1 DUF1836 domain-containing protein [Acidaminobacter sp. JC074]